MHRFNCRQTDGQTDDSTLQLNYTNRDIDNIPNWCWLLDVREVLGVGSTVSSAATKISTRQSK